MAYRFVIAPDFPPNLFSGWYTLNTLLQKRSDLAVHLMTPASSNEQAQMIDNEEITLIYANPFDAAKLIREKGYKAIVRPVGKPDEMVIVSAASGEIDNLDALKAGTKIAMADNRDVKLIGLRLLEAVDLDESNVSFEITETYQAAIKQVVQGKADVAFIIAEIFETLSKLTKSQLNILIESHLADITHVLLVKEDFEHADKVRDALVSLKDDADGQAVLSELGMKDGFEVVDEEAAEFMIDLMETLLS